MMSDVNGKRARPSEPEKSPGLHGWERIVAKLLFLMFRMTGLLLNLLEPKMQKVVRSQAAKRNLLQQAFLDTVPEDEESDPELGSYEMIGSQVPTSPASTLASERRDLPTPSLTSSLQTLAEPFVDETQMKIFGPPPLCQHNLPCKLFMCRKQGGNLHRMFWRCPEPRAHQCKCFQWTRFQPHWVEDYYQTPSETPSTATSQQVRRAHRQNQDGDGSATCPHLVTTRAGTNAHVVRVRCKDCKKLLVDRKKTPAEIQEDKMKANREDQTPEMTEQDKNDYEEFKKFQAWQKMQGQSSGSRKK